MDYFGIKRGTIRAQCYKKLGELALSSGSKSFFPKSKNLVTLSKDFASANGAKGAISLNEIEVLLALCEATQHTITSSEDADYLAQKFRLYLLELHKQEFTDKVYDFTGTVSPWLLLGEKLTSGLINLSIQHGESLTPQTEDTFQVFIETIFSSENLELSSYMTILGFLNSLNENPSFITSTKSAFKILYLLDACIDNVEFLTNIEYYANFLTSYPKSRQFLLHKYVLDFSPILFLQLLSNLLSSITSSMLHKNSTNTSLMEYLLKKVSADKAFVSKPNVSKANGFVHTNGSTAAEINPTLSVGSLTNLTDELSLATENSSLELSITELDYLKELSETSLKKMLYLDRGENFLVYSSINRLKLGYKTKAELVSVIVCGSLAGVVDLEESKKIFYNSIGIHDVMLDPHLGSAIIELGSVLVFKDSSIGSQLTRAFTSLVSDPALSFNQCQTVSRSVGLASLVLSQDTVVTTIYALANLLFVNTESSQIQVRSRRSTGLRNRITSESHGAHHLTNANPNRLIRNNTITKRASFSEQSGSSSLEFDEQECKTIFKNAVTAISEVVGACGDESVSTLAVAILTQKTTKLNTMVAPYLLEGLVSCSPFLPEREFVVLVRHLHKLSFDAFQTQNTELITILSRARSDMAAAIKRDNPLYNIYLSEILLAIVSLGDVQELDHHRSHKEISAVGVQICHYLKPLAELLPNVHLGEKPLDIRDGHILNLFRNIWFNMVVHGFSINSDYAQFYEKELERIAYNTPPLASDLSWNRTETSLELNTVLKRGSSNHNVKDHKHIVGDVFEIPRTMSYSKLMFLAAALFVESLRVRSGDCHTILKYYSDPSMGTSGVDKYLGSIAFKINKEYIDLIDCGADKQFSAPNIADQLTSILILCCHGLEDLQDAAFRCSDLLINRVPSSLCHHSSLFSLFDLLTLLYDSVVDSEVNQYNPEFIFTAEKTGIQLKLPDSYRWRSETFTRFHDKARNWVRFLLLKCNYDTKSLIQSYVTEADSFQPYKNIRFGVSFALEMAGSITGVDREMIHLPRISNDSSFNLLPPVISQLSWRSNFVTDILNRVSFNSTETTSKAMHELREQVTSFKAFISNPDNHVPLNEITDVLSEIAGYALVQEHNLAELIRYLVEIPFTVFESSSMTAATSIWGAVMKERPNLSILVVAEITKNWETSIKLKQGVFSKAFDLIDPKFCRMEYSPSDFNQTEKVAANVHKSFQPQAEIIKLLSSSFEATMNQSDHLLKIFTRFVNLGLRNMVNGSLHPFSRSVRFEMTKFGFDILNYHKKLGSRSCQRLTETIFDSTLSWFKLRSCYPFGSNTLKVKADFTLLKEVALLLSQTTTFKSSLLESKKALLSLFMDDEISKIGVWLSPSKPLDVKAYHHTTHLSSEHLVRAYSIDPQLAINLAQRYKMKNLDELLQKLIVENPVPAINYSDAVQYFIGINAGTYMPTHHLLFWKELSPIDAITLFLPPFGKDPFILQYTMRSLEHHDVNLTFFYVPQIVQSLRYDLKGYVKRFILETARVSRLFAHQIIWNMLANSYKDEDSTEPDSLKPTLDNIQQLMLDNFSDDDLEFYKKEFGFFNEVTSISGKLKPYIKKSKAEKKIKIDEEMSLIEVQPGVYLPSNPDGVVVDINRKSGKPLQSHAKAPFMATFKIKKNVDQVDDYGKVVKVEIEKWQSAIFKVGDDCRQDVLALQLISVFRSIWLHAGLDLFVFPYRVTATAPGCGVIDVLPNSTSRDMLGREAVNGLYEYYITRFGPETSIEFQQARNNLVRSLAAYSIISYLLQFKDRHNGNIMYDDQGHVLHIDFGFCFDIVPGGVKFEVAPFKLTKEMVMVLGGSDTTQAYQWFEDLCIKGYLACRPYMETIVRCVNPMLDSGLPCFKDTTIKKLRKRFVPNKDDKEAAHFFKGLIKKSYESFYTTGYDEFQRLTNGIPY